MLRRLQFTFAFLVLSSLFGAGARADERYFTYTYEASVPSEGEFEIEQWVTLQNGRRGRDYNQWNFRTELEYGITDRLMTALYLNFDSLRTSDLRAGAYPDAEASEAEHETEFKGFSSEWVYQILNPRLDPIGLALYEEFTTDASDFELETKIIVSKELGNFNLAANAVYEAEWEREDGHTAREATLEFDLGASYKLSPQWAIGIEARNKSAYPDGLNLSGQEYQTWSVGPNVHFGSEKWWFTLTVLPQVWGNGDGSHNNRQLVHEEQVEARVIVGYIF